MSLAYFNSLCMYFVKTDYLIIFRDNIVLVYHLLSVLSVFFSSDVLTINSKAFDAVKTFGGGGSKITLKCFSIKTKTSLKKTFQCLSLSLLLFKVLLNLA